MDYIIVICANRTEIMRLYEYLRKIRISVMLVPTPNQLSRSCGISLKARYKNIANIVDVVKLLQVKSFEHIFLEKKNAGRILYVKIV